MLHLNRWSSTHSVYYDFVRNLYFSRMETSEKAASVLVSERAIAPLDRKSRKSKVGKEDLLAMDHEALVNK